MGPWHSQHTRLPGSCVSPDLSVGNTQTLECCSSRFRTSLPPPQCLSSKSQPEIQRQTFNTYLLRRDFRPILSVCSDSFLSCFSVHVDISPSPSAPNISSRLLPCCSNQWQQYLAHTHRAFLDASSLWQIFLLRSSELVTVSLPLSLSASYRVQHHPHLYTYFGILIPSRHSCYPSLLAD